MDDLESLELLSLVAKVASELQNHLGISEKTLAEFVIAQRLGCTDLAEFRKRLAAVGAEFPPSLVDSVDRLVRTMHPKMRGQAQNGGAEEEQQHHGRSTEEKVQVFRGLAVPDKQLEYEDGILDGKETDAIDDTLAMLEGLEGKARQEKSARKRSRSPEDYLDDSRHRRKDRYRSRSRSRRGEGGRPAATMMTRTDTTSLGMAIVTGGAGGATTTMTCFAGRHRGRSTTRQRYSRCTMATLQASRISVPLSTFTA